MTAATTMFLGVLILACYGGAVAGLLKKAVLEKDYWAWFQLFLGVFLAYNASSAINIFAPTPVSFYGPLAKILSGLVIGGGFSFASSLVLKLYGMITGTTTDQTTSPTTTDPLNGTSPLPATPVALKWYQTIIFRVLITGVVFLVLTIFIQILSRSGVNPGFGQL